MKESLIEIIKQKYPKLANSIIITKDGDSETGELKFHNPRYSLWFTEEKKEAYIVGVNFLHTHYDLNDSQTNLEDTLEYIDDIIENRVVAIGLKNEANDFHLATMETEEGIKCYEQEKPLIEIISFSQEY